MHSDLLVISSNARRSRSAFRTLVAGLLLGASTVAASSVALAAEPASPANSGKGRYTKQEKEVQASQTSLTKPQAPPPPTKDAGPAITVDAFIHQKQAQIQSLVDNQIVKMRRLIQVTQDDDPQKPDFWFRLAELYSDKQRYYFQSARALDQKIFDAPPAQKSTLQNQQKGYETTQGKWLLEAVKSYITRPSSRSTSAWTRSCSSSRTC